MQHDDNLDKLKYLRELGIPFPEGVCQGPASRGTMRTFGYLVENGAVVDNMSMYLAAYHSRHNILKYMREKGLPVKQMVITGSYGRVPNAYPAEVRKWIKKVPYL